MGRFSVLTSLAVLCTSAAAFGQGAAPARWDVLTAGAVADGTTDCTAIFQGLLDEAGKAGGGAVYVPAGRYRLDGTLTVPANVTLQGIFRWAPSMNDIASASGSVLCAYAGRGVPDGPAFIRLAGDNAAVAGLVIVYPEWSRGDVPPIAYPPCILSQDTLNVSIQDCMLLDPYEGIKLIRAHRHLVRNITGYPIKRGIFVDECYDIGHVENIHLWPFGTAFSPDDPYSKWINTQGVAYEFARTDWEYVSNTFCFGYGIGYRFSSSPTGSANGNFLGLGADSCEKAVYVEQAQPSGLLITNGEFVGRWGSKEAVCLEVGPEVEGIVSLVNCSFWGPIDRCVWMRSPTGQFTASACHFVNWDNRGVGSPALQLDAGRSLVQGCSFTEDHLDVQVGPGALSAILTANQASGGFRVENQAGARTVMGLNEADPVAWTEAAREHYRLEVGAPGDDRYLRGFSGRERLEGQHYRWSGASSYLNLPVPKGKACTITLEMEVPPQAVGPDSGLYLGETLLAPLVAGNGLTATLPPTEDSQVQLELRCQGWSPLAVIAGSNDNRTLGVQLQSVTVRTADALATEFSANTGVWAAEGVANVSTTLEVTA